MKKFRTVLLVLLSLSLTSACISCGSPGSGAPSPPQIGAPAPAFTASLLGEDREIEFPTDLAGKAVALSFFSPG